MIKISITDLNKVRKICDYLDKRDLTVTEAKEIKEYLYKFIVNQNGIKSFMRYIKNV